MKQIRKLCILLLAASVLCLCACDKLAAIELPPLPTPTASQPQESVTPAPEPTAAAPVQRSEGRVIAAIKRNSKTAYDPQNGTQLILSFSYDTPTVLIEGRETASAAINDYVAKLDEAYYTGDSYGDGTGVGYMNMLTMAEDNYYYAANSASPVGGTELSASRSAAFPRLDSRVISVTYDEYCFTGAESVQRTLGYSFDAETGMLLTPDMLGDGGALTAMLEDRLNGVEPSAGDWYLGAEGLMAGYTLVAPYDALEAVVKPEYLPKPVTASGGFRLTDTPDTEIVDMVQIEGGDSVVYLAAEGTVSDVRLSSVGYIDSFFETARLWQCSEMTDCALQLSIPIPHGMPELCLSWRDGTGTHSAYVTQDGATGGFALADEGVEAVG